MKEITRNQAISSARVFIQNLNIDTIIRILNLNYVEDWTKWIDDNGNSLKK
jgi:hypothetical protein